MSDKKNIPIFQVDAFTDRLYGGNPAAVCLVDEWPSDAEMLDIARENALSETAFLLRGAGGNELRWFTPGTEVDLCGHATLATAFVYFNFLDNSAESVRFLTRTSGPVEVSRDGDLLVLDFPSRPPEPCAAPPALLKALGREPRAVLASRDYMAVFDDESDVAALEPDMAALAGLDRFGVIATARGRSADFVSRYFAPGEGIPEDPVTGSAHCTLIPYWAGVLGKNELTARQISRRGGTLYCQDLGERVAIAGRAVLYLEGRIFRG